MEGCPYLLYTNAPIAAAARSSCALRAAGPSSNLHSPPLFVMSADRHHSIHGSEAEMEPAILAYMATASRYKGVFMRSWIADQAHMADDGLNNEQGPM